MADEIMIGETGLVSLTENQDIGKLIQPLQREIELFDSYVAGTTHLKEREVLETIAIGDQLSLVREENLYDEFAVLIRTEKGQKLGYIPRKDNAVFARLMDAGKLLTAKITEIKKQGNFSLIGIRIYLLDF